MYCVVGISKVDYTSKDGRHVVGQRLYCTTDEDWRVQSGFGVDSLFFSDSFLARQGIDSFALGEYFEASYNRDGRLIHLQKLQLDK